MAKRKRRYPDPKLIVHKELHGSLVVEVEDRIRPGEEYLDALERLGLVTVNRTESSKKEDDPQKPPPVLS